MHTLIRSNFRVYNRYRELARRERELKEQAWERELQLAMEASEVQSVAGKQKSFDEIKTSDRVEGCEKLRKGNSFDLAPIKDQRLKSSASSQLENDVKATNLRTGDIQRKLQSLDFIDRSPSPVEPP